MLKLFSTYKTVIMTRIISLLLLTISLIILLFPTITFIIKNNTRLRLYNGLKEQLAKGRNEDSDAVEVTVDSFKLDGMLIIDKLNLEMPIICGYDIKNTYDIYPNSINVEVKPGDIGNYSINSINSHEKCNTDFSKINKLKKGDIVKVKTIHRIFTYEVYDILQVTKMDTWILENHDVKEMILITSVAPKNDDDKLVVMSRFLSDEVVN